MTEFKNLEEILQGAQKELSPSRASYNLQRGLTLFVEKLAEKYPSFTVLGCSPKIIIRRTETFTEGTILEKDLRFKSIGNYISFIIDGVFYYYQFDEYNPLFEDCFAAVKIHDDIIPEYYLRGNANNGHFYNDCEIYTNRKDKKYFESIAREFLKAFEAQKTFLTPYKSNINRVRKIEQNIYY